MAKSLKLEIEDLEERIAPGVSLIIAAAGITVAGPDAAIGGAVTAFTNVSAQTEIDNIDVSFEC